jgi:sphingolipid delta-4 desaturase
MAVRYQAPTLYHLLNVVWIFACDYALYLAAGPGAVIYLLASTVLAGCGLHPCASHFIAEHYVFTGDWETYSYYGWLNFFCYNVGCVSQAVD